MGCEISIVIPVYNAEKTLERCVDSLVYGEFASIELILVEDCSQDNSWKVCKKLESRYQKVRVVQNKSNKGVSYTRNKGVELAKGKYILFVDSDDWVSSKYVLELYKIGEAHPEALAMCGFMFIDYVENIRRPYLFNEREDISYVHRRHFFGLLNCVHLQVICNKLYCLEIIRKNHIRFEENSRMGEDFQFALDYIEKAKIEQIAVINKPLYYYIRYNSNSLMANYVKEPYEQPFDRMEQLARICDAKEKGEERILNLRKNYTYHIIRNNNMSIMEKKKQLEILWQDGSGKARYYKEKLNSCKEWLSENRVTFFNLIKRVEGRIYRELREKNIKSIKMQFRENNFSIISQNCIGGVFCHDMGVRFDSPTVDVFFSANDYLRFVLDLKYYLSLPLIMHWGEEYPIGMLGDVRIEFMHYQTCSEAYESWNRRVERIHWDRIVVLATDRNGFGEEEYQMWRKIPYPKLLFTVHSEFSENSVVYQEYAIEGKVPDLIPNREFYREGKLLQLVNGLTRKK